VRILMADNSAEHQGALAALRHPLRRRILRAMSDRRQISPRELAERLDEPLSNVSYHVRTLAEHGAVTEVKRKQVRGATQHFYRWALKSKWAQDILRETKDEAPGDQPKPKGKRKRKRKDNATGKKDEEKKPKRKRARKRPKDER
jgi:DNA-binding transcriptional ArsR family regulator